MRELHLLVLWNKARVYEKEIIADLEKNVSIVEKIEVEWSKNKVAENFTRFYGVKLDDTSCKVKECGDGKFLLVTFLMKILNTNLQKHLVVLSTLILTY
jgi:hypothetical protein